MVWSQIILPTADARCGKVFHKDRGSARGQRVALEFWYQATGSAPAGRRLCVYRCKRCGGFHIGWKRETTLLPAAQPVPQDEQDGFLDDFEEDDAPDDLGQSDRSYPPGIVESFSVPLTPEAQIGFHRLGGAAR